MPAAQEPRSTWFQRFLLPGFAFKAVVIGGGYATGRELAEFFLPGGPWGGLLGMILAMLIWSLVCAVTFTFARAVDGYDYRTFFKALLGPFWIVFELAYFLFVVLILAVFSAAAGAIGASTLGLPPIAGTLFLAVAIALVTTFGNASVEGLFKYMSIFLYTVYALFILRELRLPAFHYLFQLMIFAALLESGVGAVHAINERVATVWQHQRGLELSYRARAGIAVLLLVGCIFIADRIGLVDLIGSGYRYLAYVILAVYIVPLLTIGVRMLVLGSRRRAAVAQDSSPASL